MRFFSTDPHEPAVLAVGQSAVGIIAIGQLALGFVAIGQLARGVFVVGQLAIGIVGVGQGALMVGYGIGQFGLAGRGRGWVVRIAPKYRPDRGEKSQADLPDYASAAELERDGKGWIAGRVVDGVFTPQTPSPIAGRELAISETVQRSLERLKNQSEPLNAVVQLTSEEKRDDELAGYREAPTVERRWVVAKLRTWRPWRRPFEAIKGNDEAPGWQIPVRFGGVVLLAVAWWFIAGHPVLEAVIGVFD